MALWADWTRVENGPWRVMVLGCSDVPGKVHIFRWVLNNRDGFYVESLEIGTFFKCHNLNEGGGWTVERKVALLLVGLELF